jgi:hypothetical protein
MPETLIYRDGFRAPFFGVWRSARTGVCWGYATMRRRVAWGYRSQFAEHVAQSAFYIPVTFVFMEPGTGKLTAFRIEADGSEPREVGYLQ